MVSTRKRIFSAHSLLDGRSGEPGRHPPWCNAEEPPFGVARVCPSPPSDNATPAYTRQSSKPHCAVTANSRTDTSPSPATAAGPAENAKARRIDDRKNILELFGLHPFFKSQIPALRRHLAHPRKSCPKSAVNSITATARIQAEIWVLFVFCQNYPPPNKYGHISSRFSGVDSGGIRRLRSPTHYPPPSTKANSSCGDGFASTFLRSSFAFHFPNRVKSF